MKIIKNFFVIFGLILGMGLVFTPNLVGAVSMADIYDGCTGASDSTICSHKNDNIKTFIKTGVNILLYILGAVSVIMIIVSGIYYTVSGGDPSATTKAKNTLLYAVVGLVVAVMAYAIVNFVLTYFK